MNILKRFGDYTFPENQISYSDNFRDLVTRTQRLLGAHGGFDALGYRRGLSEIGMVRAEFWLHFDNPSDATEQLDAIALMNDWGVRRLVMQPTDPSLGTRWCWARVNNQQASANVQDLPHRRMRVPLVFQVVDPFWYGEGNVPVWGSGIVWGGFVWGGTASQAVSGTTTDITYTNNGSAFTLPTITLTCGAGETVTDPVIQRLVDGTPVDEVSWVGTLVEGDVLVIDAMQKAVTLNGSGDYANFDMLNADWMRLLPGDNTIRVQFANAGDACTFKFAFYARYI